MAPAVATLPAACCTGKWNAAVAAAKESHAVVSILPGVMLLHCTPPNRADGTAEELHSTRRRRVSGATSWCLCVLMIVFPTHIIPTPLSPPLLITTWYTDKTCKAAARLHGENPISTSHMLPLPRRPARRNSFAPAMGCATNEYFVLITWTHITHDKQAARTKKRSVAAAGWGEPTPRRPSKHPPSLSKHACAAGCPDDKRASSPVPACYA